MGWRSQVAFKSPLRELRDALYKNTRPWLWSGMCYLQDYTSQPAWERSNTVMTLCLRFTLFHSSAIFQQLIHLSLGGGGALPEIVCVENLIGYSCVLTWNCGTWGNVPPPPLPPQEKVTPVCSEVAKWSHYMNGGVWSKANTSWTRFSIAVHGDFPWCSCSEGEVMDKPAGLWVVSKLNHPAVQSMHNCIVQNIMVSPKLQWRHLRRQEWIMGHFPLAWCGPFDFFFQFLFVTFLFGRSHILLMELSIPSSKVKTQWSLLIP